jgi:excisionase family DNA binding protein
MNTREIPSHALLDDLRSRPGYMTTTEVMALLGVTRQTLCRWLSETTPRIPGVLKMGAGYLFDPSALAGWLETFRIS